MKQLFVLVALLLAAPVAADPPDPCTNPGTESWTVYQYANSVNDDQGGWDYTGWAKNAPDGQMAVNTDVDPWEILTAGGWDFCDPPGTEMITEVKLHIYSQQTFPSGPAAMILSAAGTNHVIVEHPDLEWDTVNITTDQAIWTWALVNGLTAYFGPHLEPGAPKLGALVDSFKLEVTFTSCGEFDVPVCWENDVWLENFCGEQGEKLEECADDNPCTVDGCADAACYHTEVGSCCLDDAACDDGNQCTDNVCVDNTCQTWLHEGACDDGDVCTDGDECVNTVCAPGPLMVCDDGNPCTDDACDPVIGCVFTFNLLPCDDGSDCTAGDHCFEGVCTSGDYVPGGECGCITDDHCPDDENLCNGVPSCIDGVCQTPAATVVLCTDEVLTDCLEPVCNPANGLCQNVNLQDGAPCADQSGCHTGGCQGGVCQLTDFAECALNDDCADDDNPCNGLPMCDGCICVIDPATLPDCDDDNPCTADFCDQVSGDCLHDWAEGCCVTDDDCPGGTCVGSLCQEGCGDITYEGLCDGDVLFWCEDGDLKQKDCAKSGLQCLYDEDNDDFRCLEGECSCTGRECGDDGCGGSCGECKAAEKCTPEGQCVDNDVCVPDCEGVECGFDGCDGSCGGCPEGEFCDGDYCAPEPCIPTCGGAICGDNGCGGTCGECPEDMTCDGNTCTCPGETEWDEDALSCVVPGSASSGCDAGPAPRGEPWWLAALLLIGLVAARRHERLRMKTHGKSTR